jgi:hypothetical protein
MLPRKVRGTADPSATLGMTKERVMFPPNAALSGKRFHYLEWTSESACRTIGYQLLKRTIIATLLIVTCELDQLARGVKPRDLIWVHFFANLEHDVGGCLFEICSGLGDTIDLGKECAFIERLLVAENFHL